MSVDSGLVLIGGSYAAVGVIEGARAAGYQEPISLISTEGFPPYHRPPLSKGFLGGEVDEHQLTLRSDAFYGDNGVTLHLCARVQTLDLERKRVILEGGRPVPYISIAIVTGARARPLRVPGAELDGVLSLRSLQDAAALRARLAVAASVVIVGGGYIGLEVAASVRSLGKRVIIVEQEGRLLKRAVSRVMSEFLVGIHRAHGVEVLLGAKLARICGRAGSVRHVELEDGRCLDADVVVAAIGAIPNAELAESAGIPCHDGILVDASARTSAIEVVAAGDCARHPNRFGRGLVRLESVQNATDQGRVAGTVIAGRKATYDTAPWFWSTQYNCKLQIAGLLVGHDRTELRGSVEDGCFSLFHSARGALVCVESVNRPADHMSGRRLLQGTG